MAIQAVYIVLTIFVLIGMGMFLTQLGWLNNTNKTLLSQLVVKIGLSSSIVYNIFTQFTRDSLMGSVFGILAPLLSMALTLAVGALVARLAKIPSKRRGAFICMFSFSNAVFIGMPVCIALFGDVVAPYSLLYYIANTMLFWSIGVALMRSDGGEKSLADYGALPAYIRARAAWHKGGKQEPNPKNDAEYAGAIAAVSAIGNILPIPLLVFLLSATGVLCGLRLPEFLLNAAKYMGGIVTPLSLFYTGVIIMQMIKQKHIRWQKGYSLILAGRFVVAPLLLLLTGSLVPMTELMRKALLIQASMPVMAQTPIVAAASGSDAEYAAGGIAITTAASLLAIPLYMFLIENGLVG